MTSELMKLDEIPTSAKIQQMWSIVARDVPYTPELLDYVMSFAKHLDLNPVLKEFWIINLNGKPQVTVGINGYLKVVTSRGDFDGMDPPEFEYAPNDTQKKMPIKCTVKIWSKNRSRPAVGVAFYSEASNSSSPVWKTRPHQMLEKCAIVAAARKFCPTKLSGTYAEEELPPSDENRVVNVTVQSQQAAPQLPIPTISQSLDPQEPHYFYRIPEPTDAQKNWLEQNAIYYFKGVYGFAEEVKKLAQFAVARPAEDLEVAQEVITEAVEAIKQERPEQQTLLEQVGSNATFYKEQEGRA